jgi:ABC-2 type transport system ATP-binding protein
MDSTDFPSDALQHRHAGAASAAVPAIDAGDDSSGGGVDWLLDLERVSRFYGTVVGVNDLTLRLPPGAYGLVGPNGAGKSTLIALLCGVLRPTLGRLRVLGCDPAAEPGLMSRVGLCPASDLMLPRVTGLEWVRYLLGLHGWSPSRAADRARQVLEQVGMAGAMRQAMSTYSLGMRQRCKLAQAISHRPDLLILDEPFNGLDPVGRYQITELLGGWVADGGSLILASHVLHEVEAVTDAFMLIYGGRLLAVGSAGQLQEMLSELPQQLTISGPDALLLVADLAGHPLVETLAVQAEQETLVVTVQQPAEFCQQLSVWICDRELAINSVGGGDGELASLFRLLVAKHRGGGFGGR